MRALVAVPAASEHIALRVVPDPEVRADETLVRVRAISLNRGEVNRLAAAEEGTVLGWDVAGTVEHPAERGGDLEVGTRVVAILPGGGWAEMVGVPASRLVEIPDGLSFEAASTLPVAGLTALRTLQLGGLLLGKRVLITGAAGGVGRFAVQLASQSGAQVTAIARDAARAEGLHGLGADEVIDDIENAAGDFHLILESVGGDSLATATRLV
ncbi:MAG: alcohol dehydrogenase catalytic domain-containing protein, partial [Chloroflexota bacterium]